MRNMTNGTTGVLVPQEHALLYCALTLIQYEYLRLCPLPEEHTTLPCMSSIATPTSFARSAQRENRAGDALNPL